MLHRYNRLCAAHQTTEHLTQQRTKLEAMPCQTCGENDARITRVIIQNEILVRADVVHARVNTCQFRLSQRRQEVVELLFQLSDHALIHWWNIIRVNRGTEGVRGRLKPTRAIPSAISGMDGKTV